MQLEFRGFVFDWNQRFAEGLTKEEAKNWLVNLFRLLGTTVEQIINVEASYRANSGICNTVLIVRVQATAAWPMRAFVDGLLTRGELKIRGVVLKCAVNDPEWKKPTKQYASRAKACLI